MLRKAAPSVPEVAKPREERQVDKKNKRKSALLFIT
jgi:hypothetical protein